MYARASATLTVRQESFAFSGTAVRSSRPEVFTFEHLPPQATAVTSYVPIRAKRRCTRVMYPAKVRMHLPPPETNRAKRWLLLLSLVVLWQVYTEEPSAETPPAAADGGYAAFPFRSAEDEAAQLSRLGSGLPAPWTGDRTVPNVTCSGPRPDAEPGRPFEQTTNGYVVALLVYHRLGSDS